MVADNKKTHYVGGGIVVGAALGILFGLLLQTNTALSIIVGAAAGLIVGAILDAQGKR